MNSEKSLLQKENTVVVHGKGAKVQDHHTAKLFQVSLEKVKVVP
jgi:hypothetical protein